MKKILMIGLLFISGCEGFDASRIGNNNSTGGSSTTTSYDRVAVEYVVKNRLRAKLKDPDSLEIISVEKVSPGRYGGEYGVDVTYRAKNSFGGYVVQTEYME